MNLPAKLGVGGVCLSPERAPVVRIDAAASWHPDGISPGPVSLLVDNRDNLSLAVLAHGAPQEVDHHPAAAAGVRVALPGHILLPGLVNAHTHLDLTHLGPHAWDDQRSFTDWVAIIRAGRHTDEEAIAASVKAGAKLAIAGGTVIVGDIAGAVKAQPSMHAARALRGTGLRGVSFLEFFAIGPRAASNMTSLAELLDAHAGPLGVGLHLGLQPHATNTVDPEAYLASVDFAVQWGLPLATHLAESPEEREFIARATGPQRRLLESVGAWEDSLTRVFGQGKHPVAHLHPALKEARTAYRPFLAAHVNDATDEALELLAATKTNVAYCPRASAYFGAHRHFGPHRYQDMLKAGINVCLGTDSVVNITDGTCGPCPAPSPRCCSEQRGEGWGEGKAATSAQGASIPATLPSPHSSRPQRVDSAEPRLSILDEMRFLHRRDDTDPLTLIRMATINGVKALGLGSQHIRLTEGGAPLAILAVPTAAPAPGDTLPTGPNAVRRALDCDAAPVSVLTRILPV